MHPPHKVSSFEKADDEKRDWRLPDYYCIVESDTYFIPENFKRFSMLQNLNALPEGERSKLYLGQVWSHSLLMDGLLTEPSQGTCISRG